MSWVWAGWLLAIASSFAILEGFALSRDKATFSRFVWNLSRDYPPFPWIVGVLTGYLACHFFWTCQGCPLL
jgi:hypothetical protein